MNDVDLPRPGPCRKPGQCSRRQRAPRRGGPAAELTPIAAAVRDATAAIGVTLGAFYLFPVAAALADPALADPMAWLRRGRAQDHAGKVYR